MTTANIAEVLKLVAKLVQYDNDEKTWLGAPPERRVSTCSSNEQSIARSPREVREVHRKTGRYRSASTRKHFS